MLHQGLYEQVLYKALHDELKLLQDHRVETSPIDEAEAATVITKYLAQVIRQALVVIQEQDENIEQVIALSNKIVNLIRQETQIADFDGMSIEKQAELLLSLIKTENTIYSIEEKSVMRPETSIAQSSLFTGAVHEPSLYTEFKKEIASCDRIDMLVSFIKWSGLRLIIEDLKKFTQTGGQLRVITTSYMGATDVKAIDELSELFNIQLKISYDTKRTRLHAKTYVFYRNSGFSTAYIGSSNLSNAAISSGLEWNAKITEKDQPDTLKKINATFDSYWNSHEFKPYTKESRQQLISALRSERKGTSENSAQFMFEIKPYTYQEEILEKLKAERSIRNHYRNLVVAATGTGKTVISAFDYKHFVSKNKGQPCRLLFVAHREEILRQSIDCYRGVLRDSNFGDLFVGSFKPESIEHLFISIQTFNSQGWTEHTTPDFYDFIVVDEFHHAAAESYCSPD